MQYIFILNGRDDKAGLANAITRQAAEAEIDYQIYKTRGPGDGARYVNMYCDLNSKDPVCFIAVGGSGTVNEVASGIIGQENKYLAILAIAGTCDFAKSYPGRNFKSVKEIVHGEFEKADILKVNDNFSLNVINVGFDAMVTYYADINFFDKDKKQDSYSKCVRKAILFNRFNHMKIMADGELMTKKRYFLLALFANGRYYGGEYLCAPSASPNDGWIDVCVIKALSLLELSKMMPKFAAGKHLEDPFCRKRIIYKRAKHIEISSRDLITLAFDGEIIASSHFTIDVLEKAITLVLPKQE